MFSSTLSFGGYSQSPEKAPMDATQGSPQKGQAGGDANSLIPVTIHMLDKAVASQVSGGDLKVDGRLANMMVIVGAVEELNRQQTSMEFALNDSTGKMKARFFFPANLNLDSVQNGKYVTAVGIVKTQPSVHFSLVALHPVQSPDEISHHMIAVAHSSLRSKGKLGNKQASMTKTDGVFSTPPKTVAAAPRPMVSTATPVEPAPKAVQAGPLRERIAAFLSAHENPEGTAFTQLTAHFNTEKSEDVKVAINELLDEGSAYTTIDEEHFASV